MATPRPRKSKRVASIREEESPLPVPIKVPYIKGQAVFGSGSPAVEYKSEEEEVPNYERTEIWVTKKLLTSMVKFDDPKRAQIYKERSAVGKLATFGKRFDLKSLEHIESEEEFLSFIKDIGFEWNSSQLSSSRQPLTWMQTRSPSAFST